MKRCLFVLICLLLFSACIKKLCKYEYPIDAIYVLNWGERPIPNKGVAYIYKKGTHFAELIDTIRFYALARGITDSTILTCILNSKRLNYLNDIRVVLDDTLKYDISDIKLSMFVDNEHWTMGGPWEYCIVSSITANGHVVHDTVYSGSLAFPQRYVRIVKK